MNGKFKSEVINVANGIEVSIKSVTDLFYEIIDVPGTSVKFAGEERKGDPINWCADIGLLKELKYYSKNYFKRRINPLHKMAKRKRVGLVYSYNENWVAGSYYILNIIHALNTLEDKLKARR